MNKIHATSIKMPSRLVLCDVIEWLSLIFTFKLMKNRSSTSGPWTLSSSNFSSIFHWCNANRIGLLRIAILAAASHELGKNSSPLICSTPRDAASWCSSKPRHMRSWFGTLVFRPLHFYLHSQSLNLQYIFFNATDFCNWSIKHFTLLLLCVLHCFKI